MPMPDSAPKHQPYHKSMAELEAGLAEVLQSPKDRGELKLIVARPDVDLREELTEAQLDLEVGLVGDSWLARGDHYEPGKPPPPDTQLNVMNARVATLVAGDDSRRALAGDQLYLDLDISHDNLPPGTQVTIGEAVIEITPEPHTGCKKFAERFGKDAIRFVNSDEGKRQRLRGLCARVVVPGGIKIGAAVVVARKP